MSLELVNATLKSGVKPSAMRFVLLAISNYANEDSEAYPSHNRVADDTGLDIKTVLKHFLELEKQGYLTDTKERKGKTKSTKVFHVSISKIISTPKNGAPPLFPVSTPKNGLSKHPQKRVTEPLVKNLKEPLEEKDSDEKLTSKETLSLKPSEVDSELWESFMNLRVKQKAQQTKRALHGIVNKLIECNRYSISMNDMIDLCLQKGWKGVNYSWYENENNIKHGENRKANIYGRSA